MLQAGARIAFVVNPAARHGHDRDTIDAVSRGLGSRYAVDLVVPPSAEDVERTVRASSIAHDAIVVAGGDGTIHRAVCGLDGAPTPLGVIPMGTGNDFARGCGIPLSPDGAMRRILDGRTRRLDLVRVNDRVYCTVGLVGVGSESARHGGPAHQARVPRTRRDALFRRLVLPRRRPGAPAGTARDRGSGERERRVRRTAARGGRRVAIFAANTRILGGGLVLPIDADPSDGLLDIAVVAQMPRLRLLWAFLCFTRGRPVPRGTLLGLPHAARGRRLRPRACRSPPTATSMCRGTRFEIDVLPGALTLIWLTQGETVTLLRGTCL